MKPDTASTWVIREGPEEYPIFHRATYLKPGLALHFYVFKTVEISPRELLVHEYQIKGRYKPDLKTLDAYKEAK